MRKNRFKQFFISGIIFIFCLMMFGVGVVNPISIKNSPTYSCSVLVSKRLPSLGEIFKSLFKKNKNKQQEVKNEKVYVYVGGFPLGFTISCRGVLVVAISNENVGELKEGDIITEIENQKVTSASQVLTLLNLPDNAGRELSICFTRKGETHHTKVKPIFDDVQKCYKLGIWIRDNSAGVGTLTYVRKDNQRFGALGHPVCDIDTGSLMPADKGNIFKCNIVGYKKGVKGDAGELKGLFLRNGSVLGELDSNNEFGVYGKFDGGFLESLNPEVVEVAGRNEVKCGKATIRCTIDGTVPHDYEIEIVKTYFQSSKSNKSMFIRVTDKELLSKTGGIVQGMSGSPILQNGKLIGAVTHVFVSDPSKGYGVYADWMIDN